MRKMLLGLLVLVAMVVPAAASAQMFGASGYSLYLIDGETMYGPAFSIMKFGGNRYTGMNQIDVRAAVMTQNMSRWYLGADAVYRTRFSDATYGYFGPAVRFDENDKPRYGISLGIGTRF